MGNRHLYKNNPVASIHPYNKLPADFLKLQKHHGDTCRITQRGVIMIYFDTIVHIAVKFYYLIFLKKEQGPAYIEFWNIINLFPL